MVTSRTETGLPLPPTGVVNHLLWGILARGQERYSVKVCHFIFLANHFHMLLVVETPEDVSNFVGYVKCESAHAVNRLLGRRQRTIWLDGYDSPILLTATDAMHYIRYIYLNASRANLEESINVYPGVSSWEMYVSGGHSKNCHRVSRDSIQELVSPQLSINEQRKLLCEYEKLPGSRHVFELAPNAWMDCFDEVNPAEAKEINSKIIEEIREEELILAKKRRKNKQRVIGSTALRRQSMNVEYEPKKYSPRMICVSEDKALRKSFIETFKLLVAEARRVYESWRIGDTRKRIPPGMFAPRMPTLVSALPVLV